MQTQNEDRIKDFEFVIPILVGSVSAHIPNKKAGVEATHKWTAYVRGFNNIDITQFISSVVFTLHPTFPDPVRQINQPPYEIVSQGWGEFDVQVTLNLSKDAQASGLQLYHWLRLHEDPAAENAKKPEALRKPVVSEQYEELVFVDPPRAFYERVKGIMSTRYAGPEYSMINHVPNLTLEQRAEIEMERLEPMRRALAEKWRALLGMGAQ